MISVTKKVTNTKGGIAVNILVWNVNTDITHASQFIT